MMRRRMHQRLGRAPNGTSRPTRCIRVLLVIRLLGGRRGGAERVYATLATALAERGYAVTCVYCQAGAAPPAFPLAPQVDVVNLRDRGSRDAFRYAALDGLARSLRRLKLFAPLVWLARNAYFVFGLVELLRERRPDVAVSFLPPANTPALLAAWLTGSKLIVTNHGVPEHDYGSTTRWDQNPFDRWLRFRLLPRATLIHVLSPRFYAWFPQRLQHKLVAIGNCVAPDLLAAPRPSDPARIVVAVGRLVSEKGYIDLVEAWGQLAPRFPEWQVHLFGAGPEHKRLTERVQQLDLGASFLFKGEVENVLDAYAGGQLFCHPARHEGFGLAVAEALACHLPVIGYDDCEGLLELVQDGQNGTLVRRAEGVAGLARALGRLMADAPLRRELAGRAALSVAQLTPASFSEQWVALLEGVLSAP